MSIKFSIIIPVYNRPKEIEELLESLTKQEYKESFEVIIIEDGSSEVSEKVVKKFESTLEIKYFLKENTGAGLSRNYGMERASGNYFIILDSDVLVPSKYLIEVEKALIKKYTDAYGGPDAAHKSFTSLQKAINYSMTSIITTGGIRGKKKSVGKFQPRSFNLGMSRKAFEVTQGFSALKAGEDIDLTFRLWENNLETQLVEKAYVYHKRRSTIKQFFKQTFAFGTARPKLNRKYPETAKITYWFPSLFIISLDISIIALLFGFWQFLLVYVVYFGLLFIDSLFQNKNIKVAFLSIITTLTQFYGYGMGFLQSQFLKK
ncbi:Glycosyltransferase [Tenacibaculum sp. 190524A02b]|uniref:Glycosyltransferase n=1 Tax=Tenacibaculum vairaonense TaxID=3137860 RepID=A0ABP1FGA1_9FLAO